MLGAPPVCGTFDRTRATASANTVITKIIPPFCGNSGSPPKLFTVNTGQVGPNGYTPAPNWLTNTDAYTHVTDLWYTSLSTAHSLYVLRPLNWTYVTSAVSSNTTTITVAADPGTWATAGVYKYGSASGGTNVPNLANNTIASGDYVAYQLNDGRWVADTCTTNTTGTTIVLTTGTPNVTGAGIAAYSPIFFFGVVGDTDPATGEVQPLMDSVANTNVTFQTKPGGFGIFNALHKGDPLIFVSSNGTDAGILERLAGFYSTKF